MVHHWQGIGEWCSSEGGGLGEDVAEQWGGRDTRAWYSGWGPPTWFSERGAMSAGRAARGVLTRPGIQPPAAWCSDSPGITELKTHEFDRMSTLRVTFSFSHRIPVSSKFISSMALSSLKLTLSKAGASHLVSHGGVLYPPVSTAWAASARDCKPVYILL